MRRAIITREQALGIITNQDTKVKVNAVVAPRKQELCLDFFVVSQSTEELQVMALFRRGLLSLVAADSILWKGNKETAKPTAVLS